MNLFPELKEVTEEDVKELIKDQTKVFERKIDGTACVALIKDDYQVKLQGRGILKDGSQQDFTYKFPEVANAMSNYAEEYEIQSAEILGELAYFDENGNDIFKGIQKRANRTKDIAKYAHEYPAHFVMFDIAEYDGTDMKTHSFDYRRKELEQISPSIGFNQNIKNFLITQETDIIGKQILFDDIFAKGWEGITVKDIDACWGDFQSKFKPKFTQDVFWEGEYKAGNGRHAGRIGSLLCYQYIDDVKMQVASVGGGLSDPLREECMKLIIEGKVSPEHPRVMEVQTHELLESGKLRYPNWIRWRFDKSAIQCRRSLKKPKKSDVIESNINDWL